MSTESDDDVAALVEMCGVAASAFIRGDAREYARLISHADDFTLMAPFGGDVRRGFDTSEQALDELSKFFTDGEAQIEVAATYASGDLAVLVLVERQRGRIGGLPEQDLSIRVTLVFRRDDGAWRLVHRHADPLVHPIDLEQISGLLRGSSGD